MSNRTKEENDSMLQDRMHTDSVHERMKQEEVFCPTCQEKFPASKIKKHFVRSHVSDDLCRYCDGKVFGYTTFKVDGDGNQVPKSETYHSCAERN